MICVFVIAHPTRGHVVTLESAIKNLITSITAQLK